MAKKEKLDFGDMDDWGSELDFDFDDTPKKPKRNKGNKPIDHVVDGVKEAVRSKFTDPSSIRGMIRKALPTGFGAAWDAVDTVVTDSRRLYDEATKEIAPHTGSILRKLDNIVPESATRGKDIIRSLRAKMGTTEVDNRFPSSFENATDAGVQRLMDQLEASGNSEAGAERRHHQDVLRSAIEERVEQKRFDISQKTLGIIANSTLAVRKYMETYDISWKKSSLELQFRSYAAQTALLNNFIKFAERSHKFQDGLLLNTSLPEYAKTSNTQRWKAQTKDRLMKNANEALFGKKSRIGMAGERLMKAGREKLDGFKDGLSMIDDALDMVIDARDMDKDMAELEGRQSSGWRMAGVFGGSMGMDMLGDQISAMVKKALEKNPNIAKKGFQVGRYANNPGALLKGLRDSKWYKELGRSGSEMDDMIQNGLSGLMNLLAGERPDLSIKNTSIGAEGEDKVHTEIRKARAITEIIPGYLARILREITVIRTGDNKTALLRYDSASNQFKTESKLSSDLMASLKKQAVEGRTYGRAEDGSRNNNTYAEEFEDYYNTFVGDTKLEGSDRRDARKFLRDISRSSDDFDFTGTGLKDTKEYRALSEGSKRAISRILDERFTGEDYKTAGRQYKLSSKAVSTKSAIGDLRGTIEDFIRDGHGELLERQGIIKRNERGDWDVDSDAYFRIYDETTEVPSDINLKTNIRQMSKNSIKAMEAFKKTGIYDWNYKQNSGYGNQNYTGPMAQDVRANFGEDAAPGGKKLDLVNLNGYTMAAVKGLGEKVEQLGGGEGLEYLKKISDNTAIMTEQLLNSSFGGELKSPNQRNSSGGRKRIRDVTVADIADGIIDIGRGIFNKSVQTGGRVVEAGDQAARAAKNFAVKFWESNGKDIVETKDKMLRSAADATSEAIRFGSRMLFDKLPKLTGRLKTIAMDGFKNVKGMLQKSRDLFVEGRSSPVIEGALLRAGYYRDKATGAVLSTMDDLAKAKGDIVDPMGETVLSAITKARGLVDSAGIPLRSFAKEALDKAKTLGMAAIGAGATAWEKIKTGFGRIKSGEMVNKAKDVFTSLGDKFSGFGIGGMTDPRIVPVLIQIRDILALGKTSKQVRAILSRSITGKDTNVDESEYPKASNPQDALEDSPEKVNNSLMAQVRDLLSVGKPPEVVKEIMNRGANVRKFFDIPLVGQKLRSFFNKFKNFPGMQGEDQSGVNQQQGSAASSGQGDKNQGSTGPNGGPGNGNKDENAPTMWERMQGLFGAGQQAAGSLRGAFNKRFPNAGRGKRGQQARGLLNKARNSSFGRWIGRSASGVGSALSTVGSGIGMFMSALSGGSNNNQNQGQLPEESGTNDYSASKHSSRLAELSGNKAVQAYTRLKNAAFNDGNGDGQRDGGAADRMQDAINARTANEERKQASIEASQRGAEARANRNKPADDAIEKMIGMATAGLSTIAGMAGNIMGALGGLLGLVGLGGGGKGGKGGILRRGVGLLGTGAIKGAGLLAKGTMATVGALSTVGAGVKGVLASAPAAGKIAKVGTTAMRVAQVVGLASGGAVGMVASLAATAGAFLTSPVVLGAAAVAGAAYGAYSIFKYVTRNNIDDWQRIRIMQYGLDGTNATEVYNSKVLALEKYLIDGKLTYENGRPRVNPRAANAEEIYELFDIDPQATDGSKEKFESWYANRFQSVMLHHVALLYRIDNKAKLESIEKLPPSKKLEYLSGAEIPGVWNYTTSPFKGLDVLSDNPKPCNDLIAAMTKTAGKAVQEESKKAVKAGENTASGKDAENANKLIKSAIPEASTQIPSKDKMLAGEQEATGSGRGNRSPHQTNFQGLPANSKAAQYLKSISGDVEEGGKEPTSTKSSASMQFNGGGSTGLKLAGGPLSTGESGMQYVNLGSDANLEGMHPRMKQHFLAMAQEYGEMTGKKLTVNEAFRSYAQQEALFRKYGPGRAARPGSSMHEYGLAMDIQSTDMAELERLGLLRKYGFTRPIGGETWHMEPAGIQQAIQKAKKDPGFADEGILASLGRGGGGLGSTPSRKVGGRDPNLAAEIFNASTTANPVPSGKDDRSFSTAGKGMGVRFPEQIDASASIGDGTGKYDAIKTKIANHANEVGADPNKVMLLAAMESGLNPNAKATTSSATGLNQFVNATWKEQAGKHGEKYGIDPNDRTNIRSQVILTHKYMEEKAGRLENAAGRKLEFVDEYMGHMFGAGGASALLRADPSAFGYNILPGAVSANRSIFFDGQKPRTVAQIRQLLDDRIRKKAKDFGIAMPGSGKGTAAAKLTAAIESDGGLSNEAKVNPMPSKISGFGLPSTPMPGFTKKVEDKPSSNVFKDLGIDNSDPMFVTNAAGSRKDLSTQVTTDALTRLVSTGSQSVEHLASIDATLSDTIAPLLQQIVDNTANLRIQGGNVQSEQDSSKIPQSRGNSGPPRNRILKADKSSFDNRRSTTTT